MFEASAFIAFTTADLAQAKQFWVTLLGFPIVREDENYLMVDACGVRLCFDLPDGDDHRIPGSDGVIGLKVKDLNAALAALGTRGVVAIAGPFEDDHGKWAKLVDPDGRSVILTERVDLPDAGAVEQVVGRERRGRVSHHDWSGEA